MTAPAYGATTDEWALFDLTLGLGRDLLPVVSNPSAVISPGSKMRGLGKTPSMYNRQRHVAGIPAWTSYEATTDDITRWSAEPDYGICIQTRNVRALDIDVEDVNTSRAIADSINRWLGVTLPERYRINSGKCLLAFRLPGEFAKRVIKVEGGIIEFLANGQQFVAAGTHTSGVRYEWADGLPDEFPELTVDEFEALWAGLVEEFAVEAPSEGRLRKRGADITGVHDDVVDHLDVLSWGRDGQAFITCPFKDGHSMDSGETETAYFPAGTGGYQQGHFKCLHASCEKRSDEDFLDALKVRDSYFDVVEQPEEDGDVMVMPKLRRRESGAIQATISNVRKIVSLSPILGEVVREDSYRDEIMYAPHGERPAQWRRFSDTDYTRLREKLEGLGFESVGRELMRDAVHLVARMNSFDSAIEWLNTLTWDGKPRVENFMRDYFGAEDTDYIRSVSLYLWTALASRILFPGCKADMVPVLIGAQGLGKSWGIAEITPSREFFEEIDLMERDADLSRRLRGKLVVEISELRGLHTRDMETIKAFITRTHESWVPKYQEFAQSYPRRCVFIGTTNQEEFLADTTGNRRWLPVRCSKVDVEGIKRERLQLWAEARDLATLIGGVAWEKAERLGAEVHGAHRMTDTWVEGIEEWLRTPQDTDGTTPTSKGYVRMSEILREALNLDIRHTKRGDELRVASIMRELNFTRKKMRVEAVPTMVWVRK